MDTLFLQPKIGDIFYIQEYNLVGYIITIDSNIQHGEFIVIKWLSSLIPKKTAHSLDTIRSLMKSKEWTLFPH